MHCKACDVILSNSEDMRRFRESGARVELCNKCVKHLPSDLEMVGGESSQEPGFEPDEFEDAIEWDVEEDPEYAEEETDDFSDAASPG